MERSLSPYPELDAIPPYRPESEAPPPLDSRDTDHDELTPTDTPASIWGAIQGLRGDVAKLTGLVQSLATEQARHREVERAHRLVTHALPVAIWLSSLTAIVLAFGAVWIAASAWREVAQLRVEPAVVVVGQAHPSGAVYQ